MARLRRPGFLPVCERSELAGRFSESAPMNDPGFPLIPGTSRRQQPILRLYDRLGPQRGSPGNRSIALVGRDRRPLRGFTPPLRDLGVGLGDFGLAIRRDNGTNGAFFFADAGSGNKIGKMSRMLLRALFPGNNQEEQLVSFIVFPGSRLSPIANNPRPTLLRLFADLSNTSNVGTMIDIMASGTSFARLNDAAELIYVMDDVRRNRTHRASGLDRGRNAGRSRQSPRPCGNGASIRQPPNERAPRLNNSSLSI